MSVIGNAAYFSQARVIPVLSVSSVAAGVEISRVLFEAGLRFQEITLRTEWGLATIAAIRRELPQVVVGAGTVLSPDLGQAALDAGASFLVSPGTPEGLLQFAAKCAPPFLPGAATAAELMRLMLEGCTAAKVFPVESLGGVAYVKALSGPLGAIKLCPSGGVTARNASNYLALDNVLSVAGSWMISGDAPQRTSELTRLAKQAAAL
jgi:2-dehydro-3-deoxyphosphogluconate aldolase / (4S)-4-hydroxy-2-oxoglutarate aldolase